MGDFPEPIAPAGETTGSSPDGKTLRLGELLVDEGFLTNEDIERALAVQRQEADLHRRALGEVLLNLGMISHRHLDRILRHPDLRQSLGSLALRKGLVTREQLEFSLQKQGPDQFIGEVLIQEGFITPEDLQGLLKEQTNAQRLGELAVRLGLVGKKDLEKALRIQRSPRMLGEILCDLGMISSLDLYYVLNKHRKQSRLGEVLTRLGFVTKEDVERALKEQEKTSDSLGEILLRKRLLTRQQLQEALSQQSTLPFQSLEGFTYTEPDKRILTGLVSQKYAEKNLMIPVSLEQRDLTIALVRPEDIHNARELKGHYKNLNISCVLVTQEKFNELFDILYSKKLGDVRPRDGTEPDQVLKTIDFMHVELDEDLDRDAPRGSVQADQDIEAEELLNFMLKYAIVNGASDIHLEQDREGVKLRLRIDGVLQEIKKEWLVKRLQDKAGSLISRIKIVSNLDIAEKRLPQDGVFRINYYDKAKRRKFNLDFRVATCRAISGENVNIRILDSRKADVGLENLDHSPHVLEPFKMLLKSSAGMILVSGPTGSGKTTTLYGAMKYIYTPYIKIITAEDPIEYNFPGIMQTQVNPKIGLNFARLLRSFLRMDPDVILVGEIRDQETAKISSDATQTGHLLLSTLHTNDSVSSVSRLLDLGVERSEIASSLTCVLAQRLVRKICSFCIRETVPDPEEWSLIFHRYPSHLKFYVGKGCEACGYTGYKGQTLMSEIFVVDKEISKALAKGKEVEEIQRLAIQKGMRTMLDDGLLKLQETTLSEIIRAVPYDMIQEFRTRERNLKALTPSAQAPPVKKWKNPESSPEGRTFLLSDPAGEWAVVDEMHESYMALTAATKNTLERPDRDLFREFVRENFSRVKAKHPCSKVMFEMGRKGDRIEILAVPQN
ncbi:MAG: Flp pilus assembly complex ATPase component TadA [Deltaproteobacteria bacterium]|nr:Flp pilus assembly complex ATPase component TadA [Deltaproteobacteria bacterium]